MNTKHLLLLTTLSFLSTLDLQLSTALAQVTAFTYQGHLSDNGRPANGVYDFTFQAFDAPTAGGSIAGTLNLNAVGVTNGLFTALVDLGSSPFTGPARWLQISVSTNGAGSFTTLVPRQALTPSPYAIFAHTAGTVTNGAIASAQLAANSVAAGNIQSSAITAGKIAPGQVVKSLNGLTDGVSITQGANVTINTVGNSLQISAPAGGLNLPFSGTSSSSGSVFTLANSGTGPAGVFLGNVGIGTTSPGGKVDIQAGDNANVLFGRRTGGGITHNVFIDGAGNGSMQLRDAGGTTRVNLVSGDFSYFNYGNVGIGTATPLAKLDVRGDIRFGPVAQFRAVGAPEDLRIIRSNIDGTGAILAGTGFSCTRLFDGSYEIQFTTAFAAAPSVVATASTVFGDSRRFAENCSECTNPEGRTVILISNDSGSYINSKFSFIAVGPR